MYDPYNRRISYLRVSVTDRCNLRCTYCMPATGIEHMRPDQILTFEEIMEVVKVGAQLGIDKVRITGGEPLLRKDVDQLIAAIAKTEGIKDIGLTTNGLLLDKMAHRLFDAGLRRLNISLDTLNSEKFRTITRGGDLSAVRRGISTAVNLGFDPIKINYVRNELNEADESEIRDFCIKQGFQFRVIRQMNLSKGEFYPVEGGDGGNCSKCNRLRLTANGNLISCLFSNDGYNVREWGAKLAFEKAVNTKPRSGKVSVNHQFYNIGG